MLLARITKAILLILACLPLLQFAYMGQFSRLMSDDYLYLAAGRDLGPWEAIFYWRNTWNGSYTDQIMHGIFARFGSDAPRMLTVLLLTVWLLSLTWLIKCALCRLKLESHRKSISLAAAALAIAAMINAFHTQQSLYWYSANVHYGLSLAAFILYLTIVLKAASTSDHPHILIAGAAFGLVYCFIAAGLGAMYMVFQLCSLVFLLFLSVLYVKRAGRKAFLILILIASGLVGTAASFLIQITATGVAIRSASISPIESVSKRALPDLAQALAEGLFWLAGQEKTFAGFAMLFGVGLFAGLLLHKPPPGAPLRRRAELARGPLWCGIIVQLIFAPILWTHTSDHPAVLGQFSYAYSSVIVINLGLLLCFLFLLWRRRSFGALLLMNRNRLLIASGVVLLVIFALFAGALFRSVHYRASRFLFASALLLIWMLAWQLTAALDDELLKRYGQAAMLITIAGALSYVVMVVIPLYTLGKLNGRITVPAVFMHVSLGLVWGAYAGYLMRRASSAIPAHETWLRRTGLSGLAVALLIGAGIMLGRGTLIPNLQTYAREWDERERSIISQRDRGQMDVIVKPLSFDLSFHVNYLSMSTPAIRRYASKYYGVESISVEEDEP